MRLFASAALAGLLVAGLAAPAAACVPQISIDPERIGEPEYRPQVQEPSHC